MRQHTILILGDHDTEFRTHEATREAVRHAAEAAGAVVNTRWLGADDLQLYPSLVAEASGVILAPPGPRSPKVLPVPLLAGLTTVRTRDLPFLATGESHGLVLIELAREVLGLPGANSTRFEEEAIDPVVHAIGGRTDGPAHPREIQVQILEDPLVTPLYGKPGRVTETTDVHHGLNPDYVSALAESGLRTAAADPNGGRPFLHVLGDRRFHVSAAFLPQLRSKRGAPHPLFKGLLVAASARI